MFIFFSGKKKQIHELGKYVLFWGSFPCSDTYEPSISVQGSLKTVRSDPYLLGLSSSFQQLSGSRKWIFFQLSLSMGGSRINWPQEEMSRILGSGQGWAKFPRSFPDSWLRRHVLGSNVTAVHILLTPGTRRNTWHLEKQCASRPDAESVERSGVQSKASLP